MTWLILAFCFDSLTKLVFLIFLSKKCKSLESKVNGLGAQLSRLQSEFKSHEYYAGQRFSNVMLDGSLADVDSRLKRLANRVGRLESDLGVIE